MPSALDGVLPVDADRAALVGRLFDPEVNGPCIVAVTGEDLVDVTDLGPTVSRLCAIDDPAAAVREAAGEPGRRRWSLAAVLGVDATGPGAARLLAPVDLQVIKAAGVTFAHSMIERVIEERAHGDPASADAVRARVSTLLATSIDGVKPGSPDAERVKQILSAEGMWSQYLEVGLGPDPEIFTKAPVLSSVGTGSAVGVRGGSTWNNPEPEVVVVVRSDGTPVAATLGNDVNLRDFEGRSALLLTEAKDNNASCAIGPFLRLFDGDFDLDDLRASEISLQVEGEDGFHLVGSSSMRRISRDVLELVGHTVGAHHQYPDGFVLFTGTMFAPTEDRDAPGEGFTHHVGDVVRISAPRLGTLHNTVERSESAPPWRDGIWDLMTNLHRRRLLGS